MVHTKLSKVMEELGIKGVSDGPRIEFWEADRGELDLVTEGPVPVVNPVRLFADLLTLGPRGIEAAETVKAELID